MQLLGITFILYLLKLSAGNGFLTGKHERLPDEPILHTQVSIIFSDYREEALDQHIALRAIHNAPRMTLDRDMNRGADAYARSLFQRFGGSGELKHSPKSSRPGQGENLASGCTTARGVDGRTVQDAVKAWYVLQVYQSPTVI